MSIETLQDFFLWCTVINSGLFAFWAAMFSFAPDLVYRTQRRWFPLSQEHFTVVMYSFLGLFKIFVLVFNLVPLIALFIISG